MLFPNSCGASLRSSASTSSPRMSRRFPRQRWRSCSISSTLHRQSVGAPRRLPPPFFLLSVRNGPAVHVLVVCLGLVGPILAIVCLEVSSVVPLSKCLDPRRNIIRLLVKKCQGSLTPLAVPDAPQKASLQSLCLAGTDAHFSSHRRHCEAFVLLSGTMDPNLCQHVSAAVLNL
jgi:hypothetical protein